MPARQPSLPQEVIDKLEEHLPEFRDSGKNKRRSIISRLSGETLPDGTDGHQHKKMVKTWLYNYGRKRERQDKVTYVRRWNLNQVVGHVKKAEIQEICKEQTGANPGTKRYLSGYQKALANVIEGLRPEEEAGFKDMAREWSDKSPPQEVQRKAAESHGGRYVKEFSRQMWLQLGMRVLVLSAHHDTEGTLSLAMHDNNEDLDGESMADIRPGWEEEPVMREWAKYAKSQMGNDEEEEDSDRDLPTRRKKTKYVFETDDEGYLVLPDPDEEEDMKLSKMEQILRAFLSIHYKKATGKSNSTVPWGALIGSEAQYVDPEYLPEGWTFKEPSKLSKIEAYTAIKFWYRRQQDPNIKKVFEFQRIKGKTGDPVLPDRSPKSKKSKRKRADPPVKKTSRKKAARDGVSTDSGSDSSEGEEEEEEEDVDAFGDEGNGRSGGDSQPPPKKRSRAVGKAPKELPFAAVAVKPKGAKARKGSSLTSGGRAKADSKRRSKKRRVLKDNAEADADADEGVGIVLPSQAVVGAGAGGSVGGGIVGAEAGPPNKAIIGAASGLVDVAKIDRGGANDQEGVGKKPNTVTGLPAGRPNTRQQKRKVIDEEGVNPRKRSKLGEEVTRVGPPRGQKKDKPVEGSRKGTARK